jgi:hypothetical protein
MRSYLGRLAAQMGVANEQVFEGGGTAAASLVDIDLGVIRQALATRLHRVVVFGSPNDDFTISLYTESVQGVNALWNTRFGPAGAPARYPVLDLDGIATAELANLNVPAGKRLIARCRPATATSPVYVRVFTRSYPA